jgi:sugar phosphate isomerase/epimerase
MAQHLGASAIEADVRNTLRPKEFSDTGLRQLRKMMDDANLRFAGLRFPTRRGYDDPKNLDERIQATKQAMQFAYQLGAPVVVNAIGQVPADEQSDTWQSLQAVLEDLGRFGARVGAFFAAETGSEPGAQLAKILQTSDDGFLAVAFNPGLLIMNRHSVADALNVLADRIQVVHAIDGVLDLSAGRGMTVPLGRGTADFPEILGRLEEQPYRGYFVVGHDSMDPDDVEHELAQGIGYLKNL